MGFEIVAKEDCRPEDLNCDRKEMYMKLERDLIGKFKLALKVFQLAQNYFPPYAAQVKMCEGNRLYFKSTADIASANKFQQMAEHTKKDLDALR